MRAGGLYGLCGLCGLYGLYGLRGFESRWTPTGFDSGALLTVDTFLIVESRLTVKSSPDQ